MVYIYSIFRFVHNVPMHPGLEIVPLANVSGMYFQHLGPAHFFTQHWELVTYFDVSFFRQKLDYVMARFNEQRNFCDGHPKSHACPQMMKAVLKEMHDLDVAHTELTAGINRRRHRRNLFTTTGQREASWLKDAQALGATYSSDYYDDVIDGRLAEAPRMNVIRANFSQLDQRNQRLDDMKANLREHMDRMLAKEKRRKLMLSHVIKYFEHMYKVAKLTRTQFELLSKVMSFEKADVVEAGLFTRKQFFEQLQNVSSDQIVGTSFVYPLDLEHVDELIEISKFIKFYSNSKIVFVFQVPLSGVRFDLYSVLPLPVFDVDGAGFQFLAPSFPYFALSADSREYALLKSLNECQQLVQGIGKLCKSFLVYMVKDTPICEASLLLDASTRHCHQHRGHGYVKIFHKISPSRILFSSSNLVKVKFTCMPNETKYHEFHLSGHLYVNESSISCNFTVNGYQIHLEGSSLTNSFNDIIPYVGIDQNIAKWTKKKWVESNHYPNITNLHQLIDNIRQPVGIGAVAAAGDWYYKMLLKIMGVALAVLFLYMTWQLCATIKLGNGSS